jgi:hypothetical protein
MLKQILDTYAPRLRRDLADRNDIVGASEVGCCERRIYFAKHDAPVDDDVPEASGAALRGALIERFIWTPAMRAKFGNRLRFAGKGQKTFQNGHLCATPDGLIVNQPRDVLADLGVPDIGPGFCLVADCKSIDPRIYLDAPKPEHVMQVVTQIGLLRENTNYRPEVGVLSYINASFLDDIVEFAITFDDAVYAKAKARAAKILTATSATDLRPEGWIAGGKECEHCPFTGPCGVLRHAVPNAPPPEPLDPQAAAEIADLARHAKGCRAIAEAAQDDLRDAEDTLKNRMRTKGHRVVEFDGVSVTWSAVKGRTSYNMAGIRDAATQAGIDLSGFETVGASSDRLTIRIAPAHSRG